MHDEAKDMCRYMKIEPQTNLLSGQQLYQLSYPSSLVHPPYMLEDGVIEVASGSYAAPVASQSEKEESLCFCVASCQLNSITIRDIYPIPRVDDTLDQLQASISHLSNSNQVSGRLS